MGVGCSAPLLRISTYIAVPKAAIPILGEICMFKHTALQASGPRLTKYTLLAAGKAPCIFINSGFRPMSWIKVWHHTNAAPQLFRFTYRIPDQSPILYAFNYKSLLIAGHLGMADNCSINRHAQQHALKVPGSSWLPIWDLQQVTCW